HLTPTARLELREKLQEAVLFRLEQEVDEALSALPTEALQETRDRIRDEVLTHTKAVMDACTFEELTNDSALDRHIVDSVLMANHLVTWEMLAQVSNRLTPAPAPASLK